MVKHCWVEYGMVPFVKILGWEEFCWALVIMRDWGGTRTNEGGKKGRGDFVEGEDWDWLEVEDESVGWDEVDGPGPRPRIERGRIERRASVCWWEGVLSWVCEVA